LRQVALREDTMLFHDARTMPGWEEIDRHVIGATEFSNHGKTLTVMNVNRRRLNGPLGVDLLYYHHRYQSFVLVQYKRMTLDGQSGLCYRPTDDQCARKLKECSRSKQPIPKFSILSWKTSIG